MLQDADSPCHHICVARAHRMFITNMFKRLCTQVNFLSAAKLGDIVVAEGHLLKLGRSLAFTQVNILHTDGRMVATGRHTKAFPFIKK